MKIFIDSADVERIREAWSWGIVDGVTTNPSHVAKTGRKHLEVYKEICDIVDGPIEVGSGQHEIQGGAALDAERDDRL